MAFVQKSLELAGEKAWPRAFLTMSVQSAMFSDLGILKSCFLYTLENKARFLFTPKLSCLISEPYKTRLL